MRARTHAGLHAYKSMHECTSTRTYSHKHAHTHINTNDYEQSDKYIKKAKKKLKHYFGNSKIKLRKEVK